MAQSTAPDNEASPPPAKGSVTIGEALQATALTSAGDRPVGVADAAAIEAAERCATGSHGAVVPGGVGAAAQRAAEANTKAAATEDAARGGEGEGKQVTTLRDVVGDAAAVMPANKAATWVDAMEVAAATGSNAEKGGAGMGEVADAVAAAAEMNDGRKL